MYMHVEKYLNGLNKKKTKAIFSYGLNEFFKAKKGDYPKHKENIEEYQSQIDNEKDILKQKEMRKKLKN